MQEMDAGHGGTWEVKEHSNTAIKQDAIIGDMQ